MARINLAAGNGAERRILEYLEANASEALAAKIAAGGKTLAGALKYCEGEARKMQGGGNCVCVEAATVFGWVVHFFEEQGKEDGGRKTEEDEEGTEPGENPFEGAEIFGGVK